MLNNLTYYLLVITDGADQLARQIGGKAIVEGVRESTISRTIGQLRPTGPSVTSQSQPVPVPHVSDEYCSAITRPVVGIETWRYFFLTIQNSLQLI